MPEKRIRIEKRIVEGGPGGKKVIAVARSGGEEVVDIEEIEEEDENGHTILKIRIPRIATDEGDADPLVRAAGVSGAVSNLEGEIGALVRRAREQGYTWTQIGQALGISKQAAWERFSGED